MTIAVAVSEAQTLSRPVSGRHSVSRMDSHSSVEGLGTPLAVEATVVEAGVETRDLLVRSTEAGVGLADGVLGGVLVPMDVVVVLNSGNDAIGSVGAPLAIARVELSPLLERSGSSRVRLADRITGGELVSVHIVAVLKGGGEGDAVSNMSDSVADSMSDAIAIRGIGGPLANTVAMGSVDGRAGAVAVADGRPGGKAGSAVAIEGFSGGCNGQ